MMNLFDSNFINSKIKKKSITPIQSYGIILILNDSEPKFLICQRRDTIEYADFVRGKITKKFLSIYLKLMTQTEQDKILRYTFDQLWDDLWVSHTCRLYKDAYEYAKTKYYQYIDDTKKLLYDINNLSNIEPIKEPPWGFPKGKKHLTENELECALREFKEETRIYLDYKYVLNIPESVETFRGSNGIFYQTIYFIAQINDLPKINKIKNGERGDIISEEIMDLKFVTIDEAKKYLSEWRISLLENLLKKLKLVKEETINS